MASCNSLIMTLPYLEILPVNFLSANLEILPRKKKNIKVAATKLLKEIQNPVLVNNICKVEFISPVSSDIINIPMTAQNINKGMKRLSISSPIVLIDPLM